MVRVSKHALIRGKVNRFTPTIGARRGRFDPPVRGNCDTRLRASQPDRCFPTRIYPVFGIGRGGVRTNCSLIDYKGQLLFAYRHGWGGAHIRIGHARLQRHGLAVAKPARIAIPRQLENLEGCEDPRLFVFRGKLHLEYIGVEPLGSGIRSHVMLAELRDDFSVVRTWCPEYDERNWWEKNWSLFDHDGCMHAVYDIRKHRTLELDDTGVVTTHDATIKNVWTHGSLRGGASPVLHDGVWWSFFHGAIDGVAGRVYSIGCYTFANKPPFRPLAMTPTPILVPDPLDRPGTGTPYVVFPCGAAKTERGWLVSHGYYDQWCRVAEFDHDQLRESMVML